MNYQGLICVLILSATTVGVASGAEIYKWTDEDGNVQYTDKPGSAQAVHVDIQSRPTDDSQVTAQVQARLEKSAAEAEAASKIDPGPSPEELRAQERERNATCEASKATMTRYVQSRHLFRGDENGERVYLDETETLAARDQVEKQIEENC